MISLEHYLQFNPSFLLKNAGAWLIIVVK